MGRFQPLSELTSEGIDEQFAVNVRGPILQAKALAPLLVDGGSLVLNTSVARNKGLPGAAAYGSTKGALRTLVRVLAAELAARGIRVNAVSPGPVETDFSAVPACRPLSLPSSARPSKRRCRWALRPAGGGRQCRRLLVVGPGLVRDRFGVCRRRRDERNMRACVDRLIAAVRIGGHSPTLSAVPSC